jgi:hypothetical protein
VSFPQWAPNSLSLTSKKSTQTPPWPIRIHGNQFIFTPSGNNRQIQHRNPERYVRVASGRHPRQRIVTAQFGQGWIPTHATHTRALDQRHSPNIVLASSG